jgi:hypothetical protein
MPDEFENHCVMWKLPDSPAVAALQGYYRDPEPVETADGPPMVDMDQDFAAYDDTKRIVDLDDAKWGALMAMDLMQKVDYKADVRNDLKLRGAIAKDKNIVFRSADGTIKDI